MRDDQTPDAQGSVQLRFTTRRGDETLAVPSAVSTVDLSRKGIQTIDLTPLSSCSSLQSLDLGANQLQSVDLTSLSSCSSLEVVALKGNPLKTVVAACYGERKALDLSSLGFQSIDLAPLSSCGSLQSLDLRGNQLQTIDLTPLSSCSSLQSLDLSYNQLQSMDLTPLSSCSGLQSVILWHNQLQSIDFSPLASCSSLQSLDLRGNQLQSVDLTSLSSCSSLQYLDLSYNQLQSIDLTALLCCTRLRELRLSSFANQLQNVTCALSRETLQLAEPRLFHSMRETVGTAEGQVPSRAELEVLSRVVDTLWYVRDVTERWRAHAVVQDALSRLGLAWLGLLDAGPDIVMAAMSSVGTDEGTTESIIGLVCQQIERGGTTIGLDVEHMTEHGQMAVRVQRMLDIRNTEMQQVEVGVSPGRGVADLRALWLTAYGHTVLSTMQLDTTCDAADFEHVRDALDRLGFSLRVTADSPLMPTNISEALRAYIWRLANLRATETKRG